MEKRIITVSYIIIFIFCVFVFRLWQLQILSGKEYRKIDKRNRLRIIDIPAPRGLLFDRNNKVLVKNVPSFDISVVKEDLPKNQEVLTNLGRLIGLSSDEINRRIFRATKNPFKPVKLKKNISIGEVAKVEARKIDFPGLQIEVEVGRQYIYGHSASHVLGYIGYPGPEQLSDEEHGYIPSESLVGRFGVEKTYDIVLRGIAGKKIIEVDATGNVIKVVRLQRPVEGNNIRLTIDIDLQVEAEKSLKGKAGALVALQPDTGEVLALASSPSFDPNLFVRGIKYKDWERLVSDPYKPLLNRAVQSQYSPGSTFKIVTAIAALEEGIITKDTRFFCSGSIYFGRIFRCWKEEGHGDVRLHDAIVESCDVYFYEIGKRISIDTLAQYVRSFGLGSLTGIELEGEVAGIVPTSGWKFGTKKEKWYKGETLNTVIGQGYLSATPIQMARLMATVINGGKLHKPYLLNDEARKAIINDKVNIKPENINMIKKALLGVVADSNGTGRLARSNIVRIGGKTGTTQVIGGVTNKAEIPDKFKDHAWFIAFAPDENPQIALAVFVEHGGHGSTGAAPIAKRMIEAFFKTKQDALQE